MKRAHRRIHLILWLLLTPICAASAVYFWMQRPETPFTDLPAAIETLDTQEA